MPPLAAVAANCAAEGNAITGKFIAQHVKSSFVITARGADNLQCAAGGETFIVKVRGQGRVDPPPVRDRGDGTYEVAYLARLPTLEDRPVDRPHDERPRRHARLGSIVGQTG